MTAMVTSTVVHASPFDTGVVGIAPGGEGLEEPGMAVPSGAVVCKVGIYIRTLHITEVDEQFEAQLYWWLRVDDAERDRDYSFVRDIEFLNSNGTMEVHEEVYDPESGYYYVSGTADLRIPYGAEYAAFPFDRQRLDIAIENTTANVDRVIYIADDRDRPINDAALRDVTFLNGDQYIAELTHRASTTAYQTRFGDPRVANSDDYARLTFTAHVLRVPLGVFLKISIPLFIVLFLSYLVFFIPDHEIGTAASLTVTSLIAAIAFQWTMNDSLPKVSYLTVIDKVFYVVYLFVFYAMTQTVVTFNLSQGSDRQRALSTASERWSRVLFPLAFVGAVGAILFHYA
jgi:hypothetical protein